MSTKLDLQTLREIAPDSPLQLEPIVNRMCELLGVTVERQFDGELTPSVEAPKRARKRAKKGA